MIDAEERLRHWMRDFGHTSQRPFVADLERVLAELEAQRSQLASIRRVVDQLPLEVIHTRTV